MSSAISNLRRAFLASLVLAMSNPVSAACTFDPNPPSGFSAPDSSSDLSGQGNISCANINGANGLPMTEVTAVVFQRNGDWELPEADWVLDSNNFLVNGIDAVLEFPQGQGTRCKYDHTKTNAYKATLLHIDDPDAHVDVNDSIACTDNIVNVKEVIVPEPDLVTTTSDGCDVTLSATTPNGTVTDEDLMWFTGSSLDGSIQAVCNAGGITQYECVKECPEFKRIDELQDMGYCTADSAGWIPLNDPSIPTTASPDTRCTPCLTAAQAEDTILGYDTGGLKLCWEYTNSVNLGAGKYRPHKSVRSQTVETNVYNECYETTTTIYVYGRPRLTTVTTCN